MDKLKDLDEILNARQVPEMRSNLEYRIIEAARSVGVSLDSPPRRSIWAALQDSLVLPMPSVSLAALLLIGAWIGFSGELTQIMEADSASMYFQVSEYAGYGDL